MSSAGFSRSLSMSTINLSPNAVDRYPDMETFAAALTSKGISLRTASPGLRTLALVVLAMGILMGAAVIVGPTISSWWENFNNSDEYRLEALRLQGTVSALREELETKRRSFESEKATELIAEGCA